jgi:hypothetical protein
MVLKSRCNTPMLPLVSLWREILGLLDSGFAQLCQEGLWIHGVSQDVNAGPDGMTLGYHACNCGQRNRVNPVVAPLLVIECPFRAASCLRPSELGRELEHLVKARTGRRSYYAA